MKVFIVYCHPSKDSFTNDVYKSFERGLRDAGHEILISDLYDMNFQSFLQDNNALLLESVSKVYFQFYTQQNMRNI